jgi:anaerobic dimethyl sulfoxide reductase subunit C (anchor subunit)
MEAGFNGHTLAVFTALAPCGATCWLLLASYVFAHGNMDAVSRSRFDRLAFLPVAVVWTGFIASATHLGTPANALYVTLGVGRSPLSNEVAATVAFLFFAGIYWLYTFRTGYARILAGFLLACSCVAAVASIGFMSVAYDVSTVPSWDCAYSPLNLVLTGVFSGAALAVALLKTARPHARSWAWAFLALSAAALAAGSGTMLMQADWLAGVTNNVAGALDSVPGYRQLISAHAVLGACGLLAQMFGMQKRFASQCRANAFCWAGFLLVLAAALLVRFPFYDFYLSLGF